MPDYADDPHHRDTPPQTAKPTSTTASWDGMDLAIRSMRERYPDGLTPANWWPWARKLRIVIRALDPDIQDIYSRKLKRVDVADDPVKLANFEYAAGRLLFFFHEVLGDAFTKVEHLSGDQIWHALVTRYGATTTRERVEALGRLTELRLVDDDALVQYYDDFRASARDVNDKSWASREARDSPNAEVPALAEDVLFDIFVGGLTPRLKQDVSTTFSKITSLDDLFTKLLTLVNSRRAEARINGQSNTTYW
ncbi:hypothetical protein JCM5296_006921 [Sporobolomyces johnsonii]